MRLDGECGRREGKRAEEGWLEMTNKGEEIYPDYYC